MNGENNREYPAKPNGELHIGRWYVEIVTLYNEVSEWWAYKKKRQPKLERLVFLYRCGSQYLEHTRLAFGVRRRMISILDMVAEEMKRWRKYVN